MAGLADIAGGRAAWPQDGGLAQLARSVNAYDAAMNQAPVFMHPQTPFTPIAYRTIQDPYGQMGVQPLVGFPSVYPHVLSGVPNNPFQTVFPLLQAMMPPMMPLQWGGMPKASRRGGGSGGGAGRAGNTAGAAKAAPRPAPATIFVNDEMQNVIPPDPAMFAAPVVPATPAAPPVYTPVPTPDDNGMVIDTPSPEGFGWPDLSQYIPTPNPIDDVGFVSTPPPVNRGFIFQGPPAWSPRANNTMLPYTDVDY